MDFVHRLVCASIDVELVLEGLEPSSPSWRVVRCHCATAAIKSQLGQTKGNLHSAGDSISQFGQDSKLSMVRSTRSPVQVTSYQLGNEQRGSLKQLMSPPRKKSLKGLEGDSPCLIPRSKPATSFLKGPFVKASMGSGNLCLF